MLHGHLGGVAQLGSNLMGDILVSVGSHDKVAKVWGLSGDRLLLYPIRWIHLHLPPVSAAFLARDSHLLIASGDRIQELALDTGSLSRQFRLAAGHIQDPLTSLLQTRSMAVVATTK